MSDSHIRDSVIEHNPEALFAIGFEDALVGVGVRCGQTSLAVYSYNKAVEVLIKKGMTYEEAVEWMSFNVVGAWAGEHTPIWVYDEDKMSDDASVGNGFSSPVPRYSLRAEMEPTEVGNFVPYKDWDDQRKALRTAVALLGEWMLFGQGNGHIRPRQELVEQTTELLSSVVESGGSR